MGIVLSSAKFLIEARKSGVRFDETLTLGRQNTALSPQRLIGLLRQYDLWPPPGDEAAFLGELQKAKWRFDVFARAFGAKNVSSMDISGYEGAEFVHDLNLPVPATLHDRFDIVIDGGTLEHVFHVPVAMENCMKMTKTGGHVVVLTNINNLVGHGFYQFGPEFFYRVFSPENGFEVVRMIAMEDTFGRSSIFGVKYDFPIEGDWFDVLDVTKIRTGTALMTRYSTALFMLAKKVADKPLFQSMPRQAELAAEDQSVLNPANQNSFGRMVIQRLVSTFPETFWRDWLPRIAGIVDPARGWRHRRRNSFAKNDLFRKVRR